MSSDKYVALKSIPLIDHTSLNDDDTESTIRLLVEAAVETQPYVAAVCVYPRFVKYIKSELSKVVAGAEHLTVATVVNFPRGESSVEETVAATKQALDDGADEIDVVINYKKIISDPDCQGCSEAQRLVERVKEACTRAVEDSPKKHKVINTVPVKAILETGELKHPNLISMASEAALKGGADFLKTSTGKVGVNATLEAARVMLNCIKNYTAKHPERSGAIGFKASGGVKSIEQAADYLILAEEIMGSRWTSADTFRFGASSLLKILRSLCTTSTAPLQLL